MPRPRAESPPLLELVLGSRAAAWGLAALFALAAGVLVITDYSLNNEGLLTYYWASWARQDFVPVFFYQKIKPVLAALYAPFTGLGAQAVLLLHVCVAAAAIPMLASIARTLGQAHANVPAAVVALSPVYLFGAAAGVSNVDGLVGIVLSLYLLCVQRLPFAAGLVAGALPWARFEIATFCAMLGLFALLTPSIRRVIPGLLTFPLLYVTAGAFYHQDWLWVLHFPASSAFDPNNPIFDNQRVGLRHFLEPFAVLTPAAALAVALDPRRLRPIEWALLGYLVLTVTLMTAMQVLRVGNFGDAPRYMLHLLPALAILLGRACDRLSSSRPPGLPALVLTAAVAAWIGSRHGGGVSLLLIACPMLVLIAAWRRLPSAAIAATLLLIASGPVLPLRSTLNRTEIARYLAPMADWLLDHRGEVGDTIYTNSQLLHSYLRGRLDADIYFLGGVDTAREISLANPHNGQRQAIERLYAKDLYGRSLLPPFTPESLRDGAILALREDVRLARILEPDRWARYLEPLADHPDFRIARLRNREPTEAERGQAEALLQAAVAAHGGAEALARFDHFHIRSNGTFKREAAFEREVDYVDAENWSSTVRFGPTSMRMGFDEGRCWMEERHVFRACDAKEKRETPLMAVRHNAWILAQLDTTRVAATSVEGNPALRAGSTLLTLDPQTHRIAAIQHGTRVEQLSDYREFDGLWIATKRTLYIDGNLDLVEQWTDIAPGADRIEILRPPPEPSDGVFQVIEEPPRAVAWTEITDRTIAPRTVVNALDQFVKDNGRKISWADGILWLVPRDPEAPWRIAIGVETGRPITAFEEDGYHLETWPARRSLTLFHSGQLDSALATREQVEAELARRGLASADAELEILASRRIFDQPPEWGLVQVRIPLD